MKPKYITPDNYQQFKPSELVHSFISDIEVAERSGKPMDMNAWEPYQGCLPCLGGMACLNWKVKPTFSDKVGNRISTLGEEIRTGADISHTIDRLYLSLPMLNKVIQPLKTKIFMGELSGASEFTALKHQVMLYVKELEKHGL